MYCSYDEVNQYGNIPRPLLCYSAGLCGFRHAAIKDAHNALLDIQLGGRSKELIAQVRRVPVPVRIIDIS
jgi:hypothetical protein